GGADGSADESLDDLGRYLAVLVVAADHPPAAKHITKLHPRSMSSPRAPVGVLTSHGARVMTMLHVHRAERADRLADGLAETFLSPLEDPFTPDVVAVPTRGIERWLSQRLSTRLGTSAAGADGVCANVEFPFPARLILTALAEA